MTADARGRALVLWVAVILAPAGTRAQEADRTDDENTDPPSFVERSRERYDRLNAAGVSLTLGSITPGASLSFGVEFRRDRIGKAPVGFSIGGFWSIRGYQLYSAQIGRIRGNNARMELRPADADITSTFSDASSTPGTSVYLDARWKTYPRADFFGLGQDSTLGGRSDFEVSGSTVDMVGQWQHTPHVGISARVGVMNLGIGPGTNRGFEDTVFRYSSDQAPGIDHQDGYVTGSVGVVFDYRDLAHLTTTGTFVGMALSHAASLATSGHDVTRLVTDVRQFLPLAGPDHVLALRALVSTSLGDARLPAPFYLQPTLGGSKTLRGFGSYRLRGNAVWSGSVEYRWHVHKWIEVAPFVDIGAVGDRFDALARTDPAVTPGIGVRARTEKRVVGRMDYAKGRDGQRLVLTLSAPF